MDWLADWCLMISVMISLCRQSSKNTLKINWKKTFIFFGKFHQMGSQLPRKRSFCGRSMDIFWNCIFAFSILSQAQCFNRVEEWYLKNTLVWITFLFNFLNLCLLVPVLYQLLLCSAGFLIACWEQNMDWLDRLACAVSAHC